MVRFNNKIILSTLQMYLYLGAQSPNHMSGTTRISKTFSGQTIITRNSSSDRPSTTYCIRPTVRIYINLDNLLIINLFMFLVKFTN